VKRLSLLLFTVLALSAQEPSFEQFRAEEVFKGKLAEPQLKTAFARNFGTAIREGAARGPNFAGRFAIVQWGCGSECVQMAVVDEKSGTVYRGAFATLAFSPSLIWHGPDADRFEPVSFRLDSRLLIVRGCPEENERNCAEFFYEWDGKKFTLRQRLQPPPPPVF